MLSQVGYVVFVTPRERHLRWGRRCKFPLTSDVEDSLSGLKDSAAREGRSTRWGGLVLIYTEDEAIRSPGAIQDMADGGKTRELLCKRVYFESKSTEEGERRADTVAQDCLSSE